MTGWGTELLSRESWMREYSIKSKEEAMKARVKLSRIRQWACFVFTACLVVTAFLACQTERQEPTDYPSDGDKDTFTLFIQANISKIPLDKEAVISAQLWRNSDQGPVPEANALLNFSVTVGDLSSYSKKTDSNGEAEVTLTPSGSLGEAYAGVFYNGYSRTVELEYVKATGDDADSIVIQLTSSEMEIPLHGTAMITATIVVNDGKGALDDKTTVNFSSNNGVMNPADVRVVCEQVGSKSSYIARSEFAANYKANLTTITATLENMQKTICINVTE